MLACNTFLNVLRHTETKLERSIYARGKMPTSHMLIRQPVLRDQKKSDFKYLIEQKKNPLRIRGLVIADDDETSTHQVTVLNATIWRLRSQRAISRFPHRKKFCSTAKLKSLGENLMQRYKHPLRPVQPIFKTKIRTISDPIKNTLNY